MTVFNISSYFKKIPKALRQKIAKVAKDNIDLIKCILTAEALLEQARENRPDLYQALNTQKGIIWTKRFMIYIQKLIFTL